ncbi:unnamed protein product [Lampetra fluviatilis]
MLHLQTGTSLWRRMSLPQFVPPWPVAEVGGMLLIANGDATVLHLTFPFGVPLMVSASIVGSQDTSPWSARCRAGDALGRHLRLFVCQ